MSFPPSCHAQEPQDLAHAASTPETPPDQTRASSMIASGAVTKWTRSRRELAVSCELGSDRSGRASGSDNAGGTVSVELSRSGIAAIKLIARIPRSVSGPVEFLGKTTASVVGVTATSIDVGDTYFDSLPNGTITARQDASGASLAKTPEDLAFMTFVPGKCTYQLHFGFAVKTTSTGQFAESALGHPDNGAGASVITQLDRRHQLRAVRHAAGHRHDRLGAQGRRPQDLHEAPPAPAAVKIVDTRGPVYGRGGASDIRTLPVSAAGSREPGRPRRAQAARTR